MTLAKVFLRLRADLSASTDVSALLAVLLRAALSDVFSCVPYQEFARLKKPVATAPILKDFGVRHAGVPSDRGTELNVFAVGAAFLRPFDCASLWIVAPIATLGNVARFLGIQLDHVAGPGGSAGVSASKCSAAVMRRLRARVRSSIRWEVAMRLSLGELNVMTFRRYCALSSTSVTQYAFQMNRAR